MKVTRISTWTALLCTLTLAATLTAHGAPSSGFPEPAVVSPSWHLDFTHGAPRAIPYQELNGQTRWYWYMPYKVVNHSGQDQLFIPEFTIYTDRGQILHAGQNVPPGLFKAIEAQVNDPLLKSPLEVVGKILQGEDYARASVVIWPAPKGDVDSFKLFVGGLSGETQKAKNPLTGKPVLMRRTLMLTYHTPGNGPTPADRPVTLEDEQDVMR